MNCAGVNDVESVQELFKEMSGTIIDEGAVFVLSTCSPAAP